MVASSEQVFGVNDFSGGMNTSIHPARIEDNELFEAFDVEITYAGNVIPRPRQLPLVTNPTDIISLLGFYHNASTGLSYLLYYRDPGTVNTELVALDSTGVETVVTSFGGIYEQTNDANVLEYADKAYIIPGRAGVVDILTDLTFAQSTSTIDLYCAIVHKDRLFGAERNSQRLYFSEVGDFQDFPSVNFIDVHGTDPSPITAFEIQNDVLYVFKENSIHGLYVQGDPANWTLRLINPHLGATTKRATVTHEGEIYFFSNKGLIITDGLSFENIGRKIFDSIARFIPTTQAEVSLFNERILVNFGESSTYVLNLANQSWSVWMENDGHNIRYNVDNQIERGIFLAVPYFTVDTDDIDHADRIDYYSNYDVKEAVSGNGTITTKWFDMGAPTYTKKAKFWVIEYSGDMTVESVVVRFDFLKEEEVITDLQGIEGTDVTEHAITFKFGTASGLHFRRVQFTIKFSVNTDLDLPGELPTILGIYCHYEVENRLKENV